MIYQNLKLIPNLRLGYSLTVFLTQNYIELEPLMSQTSSSFARRANFVPICQFCRKFLESFVLFPSDAMLVPVQPLVLVVRRLSLDHDRQIMLLSESNVAARMRVLRINLAVG